MDASKTVLNHGLVQLPVDSDVVEDADEEVFLLYTNLQAGSSHTGTSQGYHGLGQVDSSKDTLTIQFELDNLPDAAVKTNAKAAKRAVRSKSITIELAQDKTALRTRKGDTGSVLWMASVEFARLVLQQYHVRSENSFLNRENLADAHVLELGAGTGLLGIVFSPLVRLYTVTDLNVLLPLIRKNISLAFPDWCQPPKPGSNISVQELDWLAVQTATPTFRQRLLPSDVDLILVVDCVYHPFLLPALVETIDSLTVSERTTVVVVAELRADDVIREFLSLWIGKGGWTIRRADLLGIRYGTWVGWRE